MKDMATVREIKKHFKDQFSGLIEKLGNYLSVRVGVDEAGGFFLKANLENEKGKDLLPTDFEGLRISVRVIPTTFFEIPTTQKSVVEDLSSLDLKAGRFASEFKGELAKVGNNMGIGVKRVPTQKAEIVAYLENGKGADLLPASFEGVEVVVKVIGKIGPA